MTGDEAAKAQADYVPTAAEAADFNMAAECNAAFNMHEPFPCPVTSEIAGRFAQAPTIANLPSAPAARKSIPVCTGVLDYFPDAIAAVAQCSRAGNDQHNPGEPLHWAREKSSDHADCIARHLMDRGRIDSDGVRHSAKLAWRALALLQLECEQGR